MTKYRCRSEKYRMGRYKKSYRSRKKQSIFSSRLFWLVVLVLIILAAGIYFFVFSSFFQIKNIKVLAGPEMPREEIKDIVSQQKEQKIGFIIPRNVFLINLGETQKTILEKFPQIDKAEIKRQLPSSLIIVLEERIPVGVWCRIEGDFQECFKLDKEGIIFEASEENEKLVIKSDWEIVFGKKVIGKEYLENILKIEKELRENLKIEIKEFFISQKEEKLIVRVLSPPTEDSAETIWEIYFSPNDDISQQLFNLELVLKEKIPLEEGIENLEYIDLRFGDRVFYRFR